jgi:hypothetical protein
LRGGNLPGYLWKRGHNGGKNFPHENPQEGNEGFVWIKGEIFVFQRFVLLNFRRET